LIREFDLHLRDCCVVESTTTYRLINRLLVYVFAILLSLQERTTGEQTIDRALFSYGMVRVKQAK
jgi:hypothetical protein